MHQYFVSSYDIVFREEFKKTCPPGLDSEKTIISKFETSCLKQTRIYLQC